MMSSSCARNIASLLAVLSCVPLGAEPPEPLPDAGQRVALVTNTPALVDFWDFVKREPEGAHRFTAYVPPARANDFALDAGNYIKDYRGEGPRRRMRTLPLLGADLRAGDSHSQEEDETFRPFLFRAAASDCTTRRSTSKARASPLASSCGPFARAGIMRWRVSGMKGRT